MQAPDDFDPPIGLAETLAPGLRRIVAPNPSPMTYRGTNTYLLGHESLAIIDPGPSSESHLLAILAAVSPHQRISHIIVTHSHLDHSPLATPLAARCGAPIVAFGGATDGRSVVMEKLARSGLIGGGEGIDDAFKPDMQVTDGDRICGGDWTLDVIHTPGHLGNHIALGWGDVCFTADHVMGWASSIVSPPDGDLTDFMASCAKLRARAWRIFYPGHGAPVTAPAARLDWLIQHRRARERAILDTLSAGPASAPALAALIYADTSSALIGAATRNVLAHLIDLRGRGLVETVGNLDADAPFTLT